MSAKTTRPSPSASATLFKVGTVKKGNDGNMWSVIETKNGVKRWKLKNENNDDIKVDNDGTVRQFVLTPKSIKKVGEWDVESSVVVGEYDYKPVRGFTKFKKGTYHIYKIDDSLVLSKNKLDKSVSGTMFTHTGIHFGVDGGSFGFWDLKYLAALGDEMKRQK